MKWPQHRDAESRLRATAPYSFVPQAEQVFLSPDPPFQGHDRLDPDRLHGWIDLAIETETPFYTRCAYPPEADPDDSRDPIDTPERQEFYHHGTSDRPVIPGSSLRGAIRSLVEILAASRLTRRVGPGKVGSRVLDERLVHRAVADQQTPPGKRYAARFRNVAGGWLERASDGAWQIRPAQTIDGQTVIRVPVEKIRGFNPEISRRNPSPGTQRVWVSHRKLSSGALVADTVEITPKTNLHEATLVPSGSAPRRTKYAAVLPPDPAAKALSIPHELWRQWEKDRELQRGLLNRPVASAGEPVFYLVEDGVLVFFGPTLNFRIPYQRWTLDYVPKATRLPAGAESGEPQALDLAEALFGTVNNGRREKGPDSTGAHRGRVSFDDAVCQTPNPFLPGPDGGRRYPSILSAPKPTAYQMYLVQPNPLGTNLDEMKKKLLAWDARAPDDGGVPRETTTLRGFKRYWHRGAPPDLDEAPPASEKSPQFRAGALFRRPPAEHRTQYTRIRPVRPNTTFNSRIWFENLTLLELGALLAALKLPASCRHQLGLGKPHGMGTVRISTRLTLHNAADRYTDLGELASAPDAEAGARAAQEEFRAAMIRHHNTAVVSPQLDAAADLWTIPRLAALREILEWDRRPAREATAPQALAAFKRRLPLPTPFAVQGRPAPSVDATLPRAAHRTPSPDVVKPKPPQVETEVELRGTVVRFQWSGVRLRVEGEGEVTVPIDARVLPTELWGKFGASKFPPGRSVRVTRVGSQITRVIPDGGR